MLANDLADSLLAAGAVEVRTCPTIAQATRELADFRPGTIVLDVNLADRADGWGLAELALQLGPKPPGIVFSTGAPESIPESVASLGTVLCKPYAAAELVQAVRNTQGHAGMLAKLRQAFGFR